MKQENIFGYTVDVLTVTEAMNSQERSLFVMNTSAQRGVAAGILNIAVTENNGTTLNVRVPITTIPVDITEQATRAAILESPRFRSIHTRAFLKIVSEESAQKILETPDGREEFARLTAHNIERVEGTDGPSTPRQESTEISGIARAIVSNFENESEALRQFRINSDALSSSDLAYIGQQSKYQSVKNASAELQLSR